MGAEAQEGGGKEEEKGGGDEDESVDRFGGKVRTEEHGTIGENGEEWGGEAKPQGPPADVAEPQEEGEGLEEEGWEEGEEERLQEVRAASVHQRQQEGNEEPEERDGFGEGVVALRGRGVHGSDLRERL